MDRFDAVVAAAVGGLSAQEDRMGEAFIAKAAVKIAGLVENEIARRKSEVEYGPTRTGDEQD